MSPYSGILINILSRECWLVMQSGEKLVDVTVQRHTGKYLGEWMVVSDAK